MRISIITTCLNNRETLESAIQSVLGQSYPDVEYIIIDGASTDGSRAIIDRYAGRFARVISEKDAGIYDALNKGVGAATGDVVGFLHADDLYADRTILAKVAEIFVKKDPDSVYGDLVYVNKRFPEQIIRYWKSGPFAKDKLKRGWVPPHPAFFVKTSVYRKWGYFDTAYRIAADYDIMLRFLLDNDISVVYIPDVLVKMRFGGASNRSLRNMFMKSSEDLKILQEHGIRSPFSVLMAKNLSKLSQFFLRNNGQPDASGT
jgi:glycosyltransferase